MKLQKKAYQYTPYYARSSINYSVILVFFAFPLYMNQEDTVDYEQVHLLLSLLPFIALKYCQSHVII